MPNLSASGTQLVQDLSQRHGVSTDAATHMLIAVHNGNGSMAQFNHPEFGGAGQWMRGGMTMVSDLFNNQLKYRVDNICSDISNQLANHQLTPFSGSFQSQSQGGMHGQSQAAGQIGSANSLFVPDPESNWWPSELGSPSAIGSQNNVRYAYFANSRRLAVKTGSNIWVYDTLDHQIGGFGQQQGGGASITFTSQYGTVNLATLPVVSRNGVRQDAPRQESNQAFASPPSQSPSNSNSNAAAPQVTAAPRSNQANHDDVIETLERLGALKEKGYISEEEFASKKSDLLNRL